MSSEITIVFVPQSTSKVHSFMVKESVVKYLRLLFLALLVLTFYVGVQYIIYRNNAANYLLIKHSNNNQEFMLYEALNAINTNNKRLGELGQIDRKLRLLLGVQTDKPAVETNTSISLSKEDPTNISLLIPTDTTKLASEIDHSQTELELRLAIQNNSTLDLQKLVRDRRNLLLSTPSIKPVRVGILTSPFGLRPDPFTGSFRMHNGIDWAYLPYTAIYSTANGIVEKAYSSPSYGETVIIDHGNGFKTLYAHLNEITVKTGARVKRGDIVGRMGNTGSRSTATHLHYEVIHNDVPVDPADFILEELPEVSAQFFVEY